MNTYSAAKPGRENFLDIDPLDPRRALTQFEHYQAVANFAITGVHTVKKGTSPNELQDGVERFYEWYPVVRKATELRDGIFHFKEGAVRASTFEEDVKNNPVIRTRKDFLDVLEKTHYNYYHGERYSFGPRLYKVDVPSGEGDRVINSDIEYLLLAPANHELFEGKSHRTLRNMINGWMSDRDYRPRLEHPQDMPNASYAFLPEGAEYKSIPGVEPGPAQAIGFEDAARVDIHERGISLEMRRVDKSDLARPSGHTFTGALSGVQAFLYTSLLLDYYESRDEVAQRFCCPFSVNHSNFGKPQEGDVRDMVGNDVIAFATYQGTSRDNPRTLRQMLELARDKHKQYAKNIDQEAINTRFRPYFPPGPISNEGDLNCLVSNFGDLEMRPGIIDATTAYGVNYFDIGAVYFILVGQPDGSILLTTVSNGVVFPRSFLRGFTDLALLLLATSRKRDVTRAELCAMPEYKALRELLPSRTMKK